MRWNEVTWYSRFGAIILFIGLLPVLAFYVGMRFQEIQHLEDAHTQLLIQAPTEVVSSPKMILIDTSIEGCKDVENVRSCNILFLEEMYTFAVLLEGTEMKVYKDGELIQTLETIDEPGTVSLSRNYMRAVDINFDGFDDLALISCQGATGNICWDYYLFDPNTKKFEFNQEFSDTDGEPNSTLKQIESYFKSGCAGMCYSQKTYIVEGNRPILVLDFEQDFDEETQNFVQTTKELKNGGFETRISTTSMEEMRGD